jgi:ArsR family transcriptional regulator
MKDDIAVAALSALAHADRLGAFRMLVRAGPNGFPSGEIADRLAIAPTRMSFHLTALERSGLVRSWRDGRRIRYAAHFEAMRGLLAFLSEDCCEGHPEICGIKTDPWTCEAGAPGKEAKQGRAPAPAGEEKT